MDEAEYCGRVGIMREGRLLAIEAPSVLKTKALPGTAWDIFAPPLLLALEAFERCPCVCCAGLAGDHIRAITPLRVEEGELRAHLVEAGVSDIQIERTEPTLEDVFLALVRDEEVQRTSSPVPNHFWQGIYA